MIDTWYNNIQQAKDIYIPTKTSKTLPHYIDNEDLRRLKTLYTSISTHARTHGWTHILRTIYIQLQTRLRHISLQLHTEHWNNMTQQLCTNHKDQGLLGSLQEAYGLLTGKHTIHTKQQQHTRIHHTRNGTSTQTILDTKLPNFTTR